jgi:hypothetical protein
MKVLTHLLRIDKHGREVDDEISDNCSCAVARRALSVKEITHNDDAQIVNRTSRPLLYLPLELAEGLSLVIDTIELHLSLMIALLSATTISSRPSWRLRRQTRLVARGFVLGKEVFDIGLGAPCRRSIYLQV